MFQPGQKPTKVAGKPPLLRGDESVRRVAESIASIERNIESKGFDAHVVNDVSGLLTLGVCLEAGVKLDEGRLAVSLMDSDRREIEFDLINKINNRSTYLERAAEEILGPLQKDPKKEDALAYWTTIHRRLDSGKPGKVEKDWLKSEEKHQDKLLMKGVGLGFKKVLSIEVRRSNLALFSKIRRIGNKVPVLKRIFKF